MNAANVTENLTSKNEADKFVPREGKNWRRTTFSPQAFVVYDLKKIDIIYMGTCPPENFLNLYDNFD